MIASTSDNQATGNKEPRSPVSQERAAEHGLLAIRRFWASGNPDFALWGNYTLDPKPLVLHDLNGQVLFYEFAVMDGVKPVGLVKASASKLLGSPVPTVETLPRGWNPEQVTASAKETFQKLYPKGKITGNEYVCYSYPKIGVRIFFDDDKLGKHQSVIFDVADMTPIVRFGADELEGQTSYSFYDEVAGPEAEKREDRWQAADDELEATRKRNKHILATQLSQDDLINIKLSLSFTTDLTLLPLYSWQTIKFAPRCIPHDCFELRAQHTSVYCAVATGQMLLDFYRYYFTQVEIATAMNTGLGGTTNSDQVDGYQDLTNDGLLATYDSTANWSDAKAEIDVNRPLKSGIPGHARACAGWMRQNYFLLGGVPKRWLKIYDPWPWNADACLGGSVVWEDWDAVTHTNFIYLRHA